MLASHRWLRPGKHGHRTMIFWSTCARVRTPTQADIWTWLIIAPYTQLHLDRRPATDLRHPWERPPRPGRALSPVRLRRGFRHVRDQIGSPARGPKPSRPGPGRPKGST